MATQIQPTKKNRFFVSIHATLAGGDVSGYLSTTMLNVSIHATLAGGDDDLTDTDVITHSVSIHATLAGGDHKEYYQQNRNI